MNVVPFYGKHILLFLKVQMVFRLLFGFNNWAKRRKLNFSYLHSSLVTTSLFVIRVSGAEQPASAEAKENSICLSALAKLNALYCLFSIANRNVCVLACNFKNIYFSILYLMDFFHSVLYILYARICFVLCKAMTSWHWLLHLTNWNIVLRQKSNCSIENQEHGFRFNNFESTNILKF